MLMNDSESILIGGIALLPIILGVVMLCFYLTTGVNPLEGILNMGTGAIDLSDNRFRD